MGEISLFELLRAGVHFGHQVSRWHPKMKPYIFTSRAGIYIIDLEKTNACLQRAQQAVREIVSRGGTVLFVGTKRQAKQIVQAGAMKSEMPYVFERWLGGTFTNFPTINKMTKRLGSLKTERASGALEKYTKKEQLTFEDEINRLEKLVGGIERMSKFPDAVFIIDVKQERTAVREAQKQGIPIIAIVDTNVSPEGITYPIPANDDATKSIQIITDAIVEAVVDGRQQWEAQRQSEKAAESEPVPTEIPGDTRPTVERIAEKREATDAASEVRT